MIKESSEDVIRRMSELMIPIDNQIMMCDNVQDVLILASSMIVTAKNIYIQNLGGLFSKQLLQKIVDEIDEL